MPKNKPEGTKLDPKKLDMAAQALAEVAVAIKRYDDIYKTLTLQEKAVGGGIVFALFSFWTELSFIGCIVERPLGSVLINQLADFHNRPPQKAPPPAITPVGGGVIGAD